MTTGSLQSLSLNLIEQKSQIEDRCERVEGQKIGRQRSESRLLGEMKNPDVGMTWCMAGA